MAEDHPPASATQAPASTTAQGRADDGSEDRAVSLAKATADTAGESDEPATRGRLHIADKVVEKIAAMAAREVDQVTEDNSGWRALPGRGLPRVNAEVAGGHARIGVEIAAPWPTPLPQVAAQTRDHVEQRVSSLTGIDIVAVDITVADVIHVATEDRRVR